MNEAAVSFNTKAARAMRAAFESQKDGALVCETADAKRIVFFEGGELVGAKSDHAGERLGEVMVKQGRITRAQLEKATSYIRSGRKLGMILVELGYLKGGEIERYVRKQIIDIASAMLVSTPLRLEFSEAVAVEAVTLSPVSIGDVFLEASKQLTDVDLYHDNVLIDDYILAQTDDAVALSPGMSFTHEEACVVDLVDGKRTVGEILSLSGLGGTETVRLLVGLHQAGIVALKGKRTRDASAASASPPSSSPEATQAPEARDPFEEEIVSVFNEMQCQNHWQVLGLERDAPFVDIERAFGERLSRFDPEEHRHIEETDVREKLSFIASRLKEAFVTLSSQTSMSVYHRLDEREEQYQETKESFETIAPTSESPENWNPTQDPEKGRVLFQQAKRAYREQDFWRTIELCRASIEISGDNDPDRYHLLGKALAENPRWRQDAEKNLKLAHNLEPWEPKYLVSLAKLYEKVGLHQRAKRTYEQVRVMDPTYDPSAEATEDA
jgi:hypothetical protein